MNQCYIFRKIVCVILLTLLSSSCSFLGKEKKWKPIKPQRHAFVHTVKWTDETIDLISKWYTGDVANADRLAKANPTVNPQNLTVGTVIYIPKKLLKTRDAMTRSFVDAAKKKKTRKARQKTVKKVPEKKKEEPAEEFELFGPR